MLFLQPLAGEARAETYGVLTYSVSDGKVTIKDCDTSASGELVIPDTIDGYPVTTIGSNAFSSCKDLTTVVIPETVTYIGMWAFSSSGITSIEIPEGVKQISENAFYSCKSLVDVTIPSTLTYIGNSAFNYCDAIENVYISDLQSWCQINFYSAWSNPLNPAEHLYLNGELLSGEVTIPEGTTSIGKCVFHTGDITHINVPESVTKIDEYGFYGCASLQWIDLPNTITTIDSYTFNGCASLSHISFPDSVTTIEDRVIANSGIVTIHLGKNVKSIWDSAFQGAPNLTSFAVSEENPNFSVSDDILFSKDGTKLLFYPPNKEGTSYTVPSHVKEVGGYAFAYSRYLESVTLPDTVTTLGDRAFSQCKELTSVKLSSGLTELPSYLFSGCSALTTVEIPTSVKSLDYYAFSGWTGLKTIELPDTITRFNRELFYGCTSLESIVIPENVYYISQYTFRNCTALTSITIPESVDTLESYVFYDCSGLKDIYFEGDAPSGMDNYALSTVTANAYYPYSGSGWDTASAKQYGGTITWQGYSPAGVAASGTCGTGVNWVLDNDGCLVIYGSGAMTNYFTSSGITNAPWRAYAGDITSAVVCKDITSVGNNAFSGCEKLEQLEIRGDNVSVGRNIIYGCAALDQVEFTGKIPTLNSAAFTGCSATIRYPANDKTWMTLVSGSYGGNMTWKPRGQTEEYIATGRTDQQVWTLYYDGTIKFSGVFGMPAYSGGTAPWYQYRHHIKTLNIGTLSNISSYAFYDCPNLTSIIWPTSWNSSSGFTGIGERAFYNCDGLTYLFLPPDEAVPVGKYAFYDCDNLKWAAFSAKTSIGSRAFSSCDSLKTLYINDNYPHSRLSIAADGFSGVTANMCYPVGSSVDSYGQTNYGGTLTWKATYYGPCNETVNWEFDETTGTLTISGTGSISNKYSSGNVTPWSCFQDDIKQIVVEEGIDYLPNYCFEFCDQVTTISLPNTLKTLSISAFNNCRALNNLILPDSITKFDADRSQFIRCNSLTDLYFFGTKEEWDAIPNSDKVRISADSGITMTIHFLVEQGSEPTCTEPGMKPHYRFDDTSVHSGYYDLEKAEISKPAELPASGHDWIKATCDLPKTCDTCGATEGEALGHDEISHAAKDPTCEEIGWDAYVTCSRCDYSTYEEKPALNHDIVSYPEQASTCDQAGWDAYEACTRCDYTTYKARPLADHVPGESVTSDFVPSSCTRKGSYVSTVYCSNCVAELSRETIEVPLAEHSPNQAVEENRVEATCTEVGSYDAVTYCDTCGGELDRVKIEIPLKEHVRGEAKEETRVESTCTEAGYYELIVRCTGCEQVMDTTRHSLPLGDHTYVEGICSDCHEVQIIASGSCGTRAKWKLNALGALTIYGSGSMSNYSNSYNSPYTPWYHYRDSIQTVVVESGVTSVGNCAFEDCTSLTSITLSEGMTSIGNLAFTGCKKLTSVFVPDGVTNIGHSAFGGCTSLTSITLPEGLTSVGYWLFGNCTNLTNVTIPESVTKIREYAFSGCTALTSVNIPQKVTIILEYAFENCSSLTSIAIPGSVTKICEYAFSGCSNMASVTISEGVDSIYDEAFSECTNLTNVTIPASLTDIGYGVFSNCTGLTDVVISNGATSIGSAMFSNCTSLASIEIPESVTNIGDSAFSGCTGLSGIDIPESVTNIGSGTFSGCAGLTSIVIPEGVLTISDSIFSDCTNLRSITIPDSATCIGQSAFYGCINIDSIAIPEGVTSIEHDAFGKCTGLTNITIPESVTSIGWYAFSGCTGLESVTISEGMISLGAEAFSGCTNLTNLTIPKSLTTLEPAFDDCTGIVDIYYGGTEAEWSFFGSLAPEAEFIHYQSSEPDGHWNSQSVASTCTQAGYTYDGCDCGYERNKQALPLADHTPGEAVEENRVEATCIATGHYDSVVYCAVCTEELSRTTVTLPRVDHTYVEGICSVCGWIEGLEYEIRDGEAVITGFTGPATAFDLPGTIEDCPVTTIDQQALAYKDHLTYVGIPENVTTIEIDAFRGCPNLTRISIPSSLKTIMGGAFELTYNITRIDIADLGAWCEIEQGDGGGSPLTGGNAYLYLNGRPVRGNITIPEGTEKIGSNAFCEYSLITGVTISEGVTSIGSDAFYGCENLQRVSLPDSVQKIDNSAFYLCLTLSEIELGSGVREIGEFAFRYCRNLKSVSLPDTVISIGIAAFDDCQKLEEVHIPAGVKSISDCAFQGCSSLKKVTMAGEVTSIGRAAFANTYALKEINLPDSVTTIKENAFQSCEALENIDLPENLTAIGAYAFQNCSSLTEVRIPDRVETIGAGAFRECRYLETVVIPYDVLVIGSDAFAGTHLKDIYYGGSKVDWTIFGSFAPSAEFIHYQCTEPEGHWYSDGVSATCTEAGYSFDTCACGYEKNRQEIPKLAHTEVTDQAVAATCTTDGKTEGKHCSVCGTVTKAQEVVKATGHKEVTDKAVAATCTTDGKTEGKHCSVCGTVTKAQETVKATGHKEITDQAVAATCTEDGKSEGKHCSVCGTVTVAQQTVKATGHEEVTDAAVAATCTTDGKTEGKHCSVCGTVTKAQETVKATGHSFANGKCSICGTADPNYAVPSKSGVTRVFGADRYATSFKAADTLKSELGVSKFQNIIVASGTGFADALAGSYLAAVKNAPILLVKGANVNAVKDYIKQNLTSGGTVYLLGGVNAVPKTMESGLDGYNVKRLGGADRYETNLLILKEAGVGDKDIIVCTGLNFADSLSASASGLPILLVKGGLTNTQKNFLASTSGKKIIVGGTSAVSATVEKQLASYGSVKRLAGATRYDTSVLVAKEFFSAPESAVLAYAQNFPDGLSGGPLAYVLKAPLILTDNKKPTAAVNYATGYGIKSGYVLGGTGLISDKVAKNIFSMAASDLITAK